jgi:hypothetical protein
MVYVGLKIQQDIGLSIVRQDFLRVYFDPSMNYWSMRLESVSGGHEDANRAHLYGLKKHWHQLGASFALVDGIDHPVLGLVELNSKNAIEKQFPPNSAKICFAESIILCADFEEGIQNLWVHASHLPGHRS